MKTKFKNLVLGAAIATLSLEAQADVTLSLVPTPQTTGVGGLASVNLVISGLGDLGSESLGAFDIDLTYNPAVVAASSLTFGSGLDLGVGSSQFFDLSTAGLVHLDEVSFEAADDLDNSQADSFILATLGFTGLAQGSSPLIFGQIGLSDENGDAILEMGINTGLIDVTGGPTVPDAGSTALLLAGGVAGLLNVRKRLRQ
jgi:hypothetical protein